MRAGDPEKLGAPQVTRDSAGNRFHMRIEFGTLFEVRYSAPAEIVVVAQGDVPQALRRPQRRDVLGLLKQVVELPEKRNRREDHVGRVARPSWNQRRAWLELLRP